MCPKSAHSKIVLVQSVDIPPTLRDLHTKTDVTVRTPMFPSLIQSSDESIPLAIQTRQRTGEFFAVHCTPDTDTTVQSSCREIAAKRDEYDSSKPLRLRILSSGNGEP